MNNIDKTSNHIYIIWTVWAVFAVCIFVLSSTYAHAQNEEVAQDIEKSESTMIPYDVVKFRSLDKITAQTKIFEVKVGSTVKYGPLYIKVQSCQKNPPIEAPESAAFVQIWEISSEQKAQWIFSGWMFASSPGLSSMDHPVYDVWVLDCLKLEEGKELDKTLEDEQSDNKEDKSKDTAKDNKKADKE